MKVKNTNRYLTLFLFNELIIITLYPFLLKDISHFYSELIYPKIEFILRNLFGWLAFSIGDIIYLFLFLLFLKLLINLLFNSKKNRLDSLFKIGSISSIIIFCFYLFWGINYYRTPLYKTLNFKSTSYSNQDLIHYSKYIVYTINKIQFSITKDKNEPVKIPYTPKDILLKSAKSYTYLAINHPMYSYLYKSIKPSLYSIPLTYMGYAGYLNPLTGEAQVNTNIPRLSLPLTSCHEIAHQLGYAAEQEANYIGFLAATSTNDPYFSYSAYLMAVSYTLNDLYKKDRHAFDKIYASLNKGIRINFDQNRKFWNSYKNPLEPYFKSFYNAYLKVNNQKSGIKSYSYVVSLLIADFKSKQKT